MFGRTTEARFAARKGDDVPGPGSYNYKYGFNPDGTVATGPQNGGGAGAAGGARSVNAAQYFDEISKLKQELAKTRRSLRDNETAKGRLEKKVHHLTQRGDSAAAAKENAELKRRDAASADEIRKLRAMYTKAQRAAQQKAVAAQTLETLQREADERAAALRTRDDELAARAAESEALAAQTLLNEQQLAALRDELNRRDAAVTQSQAAASTLEARLAAVHAESAQTAEQLSAEQRRIAALEQQTRADAAAMDAQRDAVARACRAQLDGVAHVRGDVDALRDAVRTFRATVGGDLAQLGAQLAAVHQQRSTAQHTELVAARDAHAESAAHARALQAALDAATGEQQQRADAFNALTEQYTAACAERDDNAARAAALRDEADALAAQLVAAQANSAAASDTVAAEQQRRADAVNALTEQYTAACAERDDNATRAAALRDEADALAAQLATAQADSAAASDAHNAYVATMADDHVALNKQLDGVLTHVNELTAALTDEQTRAAAAAAQHAEQRVAWQQRLAAADAALVESQSRAAAAAAETRADAEARAAADADSLAQLRGALDAANAKLAETRADAKTRAVADADSLAQLRSALDVANTRADAATADTHALAAANAKLAEQQSRAAADAAADADSVAQLRDALDVANERADAATADAHALTAANAELAEHAARLADIEDTLQMDLGDTENMATLKVELRMMKARIDDDEAEMQRLAAQNAKLIGHSNHRQKIHLHQKLKDEAFALKKENRRLRTDTQKQKVLVRQLRDQVALLQGRAGVGVGAGKPKRFTRAKMNTTFGRVHAIGGAGSGGNGAAAAAAAGKDEKANAVVDKENTYFHNV